MPWESDVLDTLRFFQDILKIHGAFISVKDNVGISSLQLAAVS